MIEVWKVLVKPDQLMQSACIVFVNAKGEILLRLRDNRADIPFPNQWDFIGGLVEPGETVEQALHRETMEEISEVLADYVYWGAFQGDIVLIHIYVAPLDKSAAKLHLTEGQRVAFFQPELAAALPLCPWVTRMLPDFVASAAYAKFARIV